ncbi:MAG: Ig-like domain repeat protein, partial [Candidatus Thermoplasmatota archaeon]|nr:Ig-like domain repeat protein [Candidatus Thermoplasmatota archaeon]
LPYAPSSSEAITIVVDIPTNITLTLFSDRIAPKNYVVGEGRLLANGSEPMPGREVGLRMDGAFIQYVTTNADGTFAFTIDTENMTKGAHTLKASFDLREQVWRYSEAEATFVILTPGYTDYPFFPWIPGWNIGFSDIPYLFFGENAYNYWMMALLAVGILVKALQVRKARRKAPEGAAEENEASEEVEEPTETEPEKAPDWLPGPNEKVVWHYNSLVSFLRRRRRVGIEDTMTHWEVAELLRTLGYPEGATRNATLLFEKAFYSGAALSEADVIQMGSSAHILKRVGGARPAG